MVSFQYGSIRPRLQRTGPPWTKRVDELIGRYCTKMRVTILYEIHDITRFNRVQEFASYARLVTCAHESAGQTYGTGGAKMGHVHVTWAFSDAAVLFLRHTPGGKKLLAEIERKQGKGKALSILAHKIGRAVFYMLSRRTVFSMDTFRAA